MITDKKGDAAVSDIEKWSKRIALTTDEKVDASAYYDADSNTYVLRLAKGSRVLLFRLSEDQIRTPDREAECEKTLKKKVKDLSS
ncbi:MAG: hypothetical protein ACE5JU_10810 [Candidatus Binatia bacterium]